MAQPRLHLKCLVGQVICNRGKGNAPFGPNRCRVYTQSAVEWRFFAIAAWPFLLIPDLIRLIPGLTRDLLAREGPPHGPSVHFFPGFFARRSTHWTFRTTEGIPSRGTPLHYASLRSGPSHFATLRLTTSPLWAPLPTLVRGCTSPLEGIPSPVPGSDPSLLPSPLKHTYPVQTRLPGITLCFNYPLNTPLKHTRPVLSHLQCLILCFNHSLHPRLKHTHPIQTYLQCHVLCFNHPFNTPLKHTHHVLSHLQDLTLCFNHSLHPRLNHTHPIHTHLLRPAPCFNAGMLPEGKRSPLGLH